MNKSLIFTLGALIIIVIAGVWFWATRPSDDIVPEVPVVVQPVTETPATYVYKDDVRGFSITLPTILSTTSSQLLYHVDASHTYSGAGPDESISGVKFTIPSVIATGTNLSADSYISVEYLEKGQVCDAVALIGVPEPVSEIVRDGTRSYSFASSSEAAAGNRYEEYVYALPDSNPCIAVRYFIHYGAIENYDQDTIKEFDRTKLLTDFDSIRETLVINQ